MDLLFKAKKLINLLSELIKSFFIKSLKLFKLSPEIILLFKLFFLLLKDVSWWYLEPFTGEIKKGLKSRTINPDRKKNKNLRVDFNNYFYLRPSYYKTYWISK